MQDQPIDASIGDVVRRVLGEEDLDAEQVLEVVVETLASRHVDVELRKRGRRVPYTPGNERTNALTAMLDALHEISARAGAGLGTAPIAVKAHTDAAQTDDAQTTTDPQQAEDVKEKQRIRQALWQMLCCGQLVAERDAKLLDDEDDRPLMRLVRD